MDPYTTLKLSRAIRQMPHGPLSPRMEALKGIAQGIGVGLILAVPFIFQMLKDHAPWWT